MSDLRIVKRPPEIPKRVRAAIKPLTPEVLRTDILDIQKKAHVYMIREFMATLPFIVPMLTGEEMGLRFNHHVNKTVISIDTAFLMRTFHYQDAIDEVNGQRKDGARDARIARLLILTAAAHSSVRDDPRIGRRARAALVNADVLGENDVAQSESYLRNVYGWQYASSIAIKYIHPEAERDNTLAAFRGARRIYEQDKGEAALAVKHAANELEVTPLVIAPMPGWYAIGNPIDLDQR